MFKKLCKKIGVAEYRRFRWATWILLFSMGGLAVVINNRDAFFPKEVVSDIDYLYRLLWVLPFAFIGFSCLAFVVSIIHDGHDKPWSSYIFNYFPRLIALSLLIFSVLHLFEASSGIVYYYFSSGLALYFGFKIETFKLENIKI